VTYTILNTGNAALTAQQAVAITGPFGWLRSESDVLAASPELLPGERWTVTAPIAGVVPALRLSADVTVTPVVTDASGSTSALGAVHAAGQGWAVPWTLLVILVLLVAAAILVPGQVRRRRRHRTAQEDLRVQQAVERALGERASAGVSRG
jgi:hypothetical protein